MTPLSERILEIVVGRGSVSFAELDRVEGFGGGDQELIVDGDQLSNVIVWQRLTEAAVDAIAELQREKFIELKGASRLIYLIDGCSLRLPLAKSRRHYKKPRWWPAVLNATAAGREALHQKAAS